MSPSISSSAPASSSTVGSTAGSTTGDTASASLSSRLGAHVLAFLVAVLFGLTFISTKWLYGFGMGPFAVLMWRSLLAYGFLLLIAPKNLWSGNLRDELRIAALGIVSSTLYLGLQNLAIAWAPASSVSVVASTAPLMTALLALVWLRAFRMHWKSGLGLCSAATGLCLVLFDSAAMQDLPLTGYWLALGSALGWGLYSMILRTVADRPILFVARKATGYGMMALLPFFLLEEPTEVSVLLEPVVIANLLFLAVGATALSFMLWHKAVRVLGTQGASPWLYASPLVTVTVGLAFFNESMSFVGLMGAAMILCGVYIAQTGLAKIAFEISRRA